MLGHQNSVSNNLVEHKFPDPINPNPLSCASISSIEISVFVSINYTVLYTSNASGKLLDISESFIVFIVLYCFHYSFFFFDVVADELIFDLNILVLFSLFIVFP